ncbi:acyl-CoA dehydrogenase family protein [Pimelobacter simplex]|uniref:acyl-CoA dehydrogenase family protein n=1 Tax=Nocardioides simplex TaxID=2045 RepID=UPI003AAE94AF
MTAPLALDDVRTAVARLAEQAHAGAPTRERERTVLSELVTALRATGLPRLRVPRELGGAGASVADLAALLVEVAAAESNLTQIVRGHLGFVELLLQRRDDPVAASLLAAAGRGEIFGPAASSKAAGSGAPGGAAGVVTDGAGTERPSGQSLTDGVWLHDDGEGLRLSGTKYYSTGSWFADWINVLVPADDGFVEVVVSRTDPGVQVVDDWNGFGQRLTASGTAVFSAVPVPEDHVLSLRDPDVARYLEAFYQLVHSATQAGITRRAADDSASLVRARRRSYPLATVPEAARDPQVLHVVGEVASRALTTRATVVAVGAALDAFTGAGPAERAVALDRAVVESAATQVTNSRLAGEAGWLLFDAASASAVDADKALDRHWRNARTIASHNPSIYKARLVGEYVVHGTLPDSPLTAQGRPQTSAV